MLSTGRGEQLLESRPQPHRAKAHEGVERLGYFSSTSPILDIGCGTGIVVKYLRERGWNVFGSELGAPKLLPALDRVVWIRRSATDLDEEFRQAVGCILLLDVIEHIENDVEFIRSMIDAFPNCRCFIITVPARREVWSNFDEYYGHYRRYDRCMLSRTLAESGLVLRFQQYFFHSLYLTALAINLLRLTRKVHVSATQRPRIDRLIARFLEFETWLLLPSIPGLSIIGVATKPTPAPPKRSSSPLVSPC